MRKRHTKKTLDRKLSRMTIIIFAVFATVIILFSYLAHLGIMITENTSFVSEIARMTTDIRFSDSFSRRARDLTLAFGTESFQKALKEATEKNDESIVIGWMKAHNSASKPYTVYEQYQGVLSDMKTLKQEQQVTRVSIESVKDGKVITLIIDDNPLNINSTVTELYGQETFPKKPFSYLLLQNDLYTSCEAVATIYDPDTKNPCGRLVIDVSMKKVEQQARFFLFLSLLFIIIGTYFFIRFNIRSTKEIVTIPIKKIMAGTREFSSDQGKCTHDDVITLDLHSGDELEDLYHEIRDMQNRIVDYTEEITRITAEREHLQGQIDMAVKLKLNLMPNSYPVFPDETSFDIYMDMMAVERIGGDYYDFFRIDTDHIAIVMASVFDGGTSSALFMVAFKIILTQFLSYNLSLSDMIFALNNRLYRDNEDNLTLSAWFGVYEISTGNITAVNAGFEAPLLIWEEGVSVIEEDDRGWVIGLTEDMIFQEYTFGLNPGEKLLLYSNGVIDAANPASEAFGTDRLKDAVLDAENAQTAIGAAQQAIATHMMNAPLEDDATMVCIERMIGE